MFKSTKGTDEAVNELLDHIDAREEKIQSKIEEMQQEATTIKRNIDDLMMELVDCELNEDEKRQEDINKKASSLRNKYNEIQDKIKAYEGTLKDHNFIEIKIPNVIDIAKKQNAERGKVIKQKIALKEELQGKMAEIEKQIKAVDLELDNLYFRTEAKKLKPLLKYIEPRKIKGGYEESYLSCLISGEKELLEQYIEPDIEEYKVPEDLCIMDNYIPSFEAEKHEEENRKRLGSWA